MARRRALTASELFLELSAAQRLAHDLCRQCDGTAALFFSYSRGDKRRKYSTAV